MQRYANPQAFIKIADALLPWLKVATALAFVIGLYLALLVAPADYQQSETVRIMFVHVPTASLSMMVFGGMTAASIVAMIWGHRVADLFAKASAPVGAAFTFLALFTGSFWGRPMWGTWWEWDARITSEFVLLFIYFGYMGIWQAIDDPIRAAKAARITAIVGAVNLPIIKFSVDWWNTLHQPASLARLDGPAIDGSMLTPLFVMWAAFSLFYITVSLMGTKTEILRFLARARAMRRTAGV